MDFGLSILVLYEDKMNSSKYLMRIYRGYLIFCQLHVNGRKFLQHNNARPHVLVKGPPPLP